MFLLKMNKIILKKSAVMLALLLVFSCSSDPYLYDRTGFDQDARPVVAPNPNSPKPVAPDYYRQQQYGAPYQQQMPPQGYAPYPQSYGYPQQYQGGGSRYYSNPYAIPPATQYYQRYDVDQYYVPPTYYNNSGGQQMRTTGYE
jgi:hypothetical protein